jgi:predicted nucleic acid-binding Zn ribbon protein
MTDEQEPAKGADLVREALERARTDARARAAKTAGTTRRTARSSAREASRAGRDPGEPVPFGVALTDLLAQRGWQAQAAGASVLSRWESLVGEQVAAHSRPVALRDGQLVIEAETTAWATQLRLLSRTLTAKLTEQLGADVVRSLVIRGPSGPDWRHGALRVTGGRGPRDTYG